MTKLYRQLNHGLVIATLASAANAELPARWQYSKIGLDGYTEIEAASQSGYVAGSTGQNVWLYNGTSTVRVGLTGPANTSSSGAQESTFIGLAENGHVIGFSKQYIPSSIRGGTQTWVYDGVSTKQIGLTGADYQASNGKQSAHISAFNNSGQVAGYNLADTFSSSDTWFYNGSYTQRIGLTDSRHVSSTSGLRYSTVIEMNESGHVIGDSGAFREDGLGIGETLWQFRDNTTRRIGLYEGMHSNSNGYSDNSFIAQNVSGQVIGHARQVTSSSSVDQSGWIHHNNTSVQIGLTGSQYTQENGHSHTQLTALNNQGQVIGITRRYDSPNSTYTRNEAWLYNGSDYTLLGLTDDEHTDMTGGRSHTVDHLNNQGHVAGSSRRSTRLSRDNGQTAWIFDGTSTTRAGLTGEEHTRPNSRGPSDNYPNDFKYSEVDTLNENGQAIGTSRRYSDSGEYLGESTWFFDGTDTVEIGLLGEDYTDENGRRDNSLTHMTDSGLVAGIAELQSQYTYGEVAWVYDSHSDQTFELKLSENFRGDSRSKITYIGEDGLVLGTYRDYEGSAHTSAFYFTVEDGLHDLSDMLTLTNLDMAEEGWEELASSVHYILPAGNAAGQITGTGKLNGTGASYLLTPAEVPLPATAWLFISGLSLLAGLKHRKKHGLPVIG